MDAGTATDEYWNGFRVISRGANRVCARDPDDPARCFKFELPPGDRTRVGRRQRLRRWLALRFPALGENRTELRAYRRLRQRLGAALDGRMAACHGLVDTAAGPALHCDCVLQDDGQPASSLYRHLFIQPAYPAGPLCAAVDAFEAWLLANDVPLFDLNAGNFVVVGPAAAPRLVCVDAKSVLSGKEILPLSRWSRRLMHRKLARRCQRLRERIRAALAGAPAATATLAGRQRPH